MVDANVRAVAAGLGGSVGISNLSKTPPRQRSSGGAAVITFPSDSPLAVVRVCSHSHQTHRGDACMRRRVFDRLGSIDRFDRGRRRRNAEPHPYLSTIRSSPTHHHFPAQRTMHPIDRFACSDFPPFSITSASTQGPHPRQASRSHGRPDRRRTPRAAHLPSHKPDPRPTHPLCVCVCWGQAG